MTEDLKGMNVWKAEMSYTVNILMTYAMYSLFFNCSQRIHNYACYKSCNMLLHSHTYDAERIKRPWLRSNINKYITKSGHELWHLLNVFPFKYFSVY